MRPKKDIKISANLFCTIVVCWLLNPMLMFGQLGTTATGSYASEIPLDTAETARNDSFFSQRYLTGDWWGGRSFLEKRGVNFDLRYSSTYQGLIQEPGRRNLITGVR